MHNIKSHQNSKGILVNMYTLIDTLNYCIKVSIKKKDQHFANINSLLKDVPFLLYGIHYGAK